MLSTVAVVLRSKMVFSSYISAAKTTLFLLPFPCMLFCMLLPIDGSLASTLSPPSLRQLYLL